MDLAACEREIERLKKALCVQTSQLAVHVKERDLLNLYFQNILEHSPVGIIVLDRKGIPEVINATAKQLLGKNASPKALQASFSAMLPSLNDPGNATPNRYREVSIDGGRRVIDIAVSTLKDAAQTAIGYIFMLQDVTERETLRAETEHNRRLSALGTMASQVAHEIRNPLGSIELLASTLRRELSDSSQMELIDLILSSVRGLNQIVATYLQFSRKINLSPIPTTLAMLLDEAKANLRTDFADRQLHFDESKVDRELMAVVDPTAIRQIFVNLLANAIHAIEKQGTIEIEISKNKKTQHINIIIKDTGCGMDSAQLAQAMEPFFTTKTKGTGLGLAICKGLIQAHGGTIVLTSQPDKGTSVEIRIPQA